MEYKYALDDNEDKLFVIMGNKLIRVCYECLVHPRVCKDTGLCDKCLIVNPKKTRKLRTKA